MKYFLLITGLMFLSSSLASANDDAPVLPNVTPPVISAPALEPASGYPTDVTSIIKAYAFATSPLQSNGAVFMTVTSPIEDRIIAASSPMAEKAELHVNDTTGGIMQMRKIEAFEIKAGEVFNLEPKGAHIMLIKLKEKLRVGGELPITVTFEKAGAINIVASIIAPGTTPADQP